MVTDTPLEAELRSLAGSVPDPELPVLTLAELGVLRGVDVEAPGRVTVRLTPTYTGCPAIETMSADIERVLHDHGVPEVSVVTVLAPAWSTDDISAEGRRKLAEFGIAPPRAHSADGGPVPLTLSVRCPHCGSTDTELLAGSPPRRARPCAAASPAVSRSTTSRSCRCSIRSGSARSNGSRTMRWPSPSPCRPSCARPSATPPASI
ncbi:hypothetical protein SMICM17S_06759 [Streptomyces microflavus]